jgi:putative lipoprotein
MKYSSGRLNKVQKFTLFLISIFTISALLLAACNSSENKTDLSGITWQLVSYGSASGPTPAVAGVETSLAFGKDGQVSGSMGCNQFSGSYSLKDGKITFGALAATLMACPDPQMNQENAAFKIMSGTVSYEVNGNSLTLMAAGNSVMNLTSK